jgi:hypothetical protein
MKPKIQYEELEMTKDAWMRRRSPFKRHMPLDPNDPNPFNIKAVVIPSLSKRTEEIIDHMMYLGLPASNIPIKTSLEAPSGKISDGDQGHIMVLKGLFANNTIEMPAFDIDLELCQIKRGILLSQLSLFYNVHKDLLIDTRFSFQNKH